MIELLLLSIELHGGSSGRALASTMAQLQLQPPAPFNFKAPDEWPRWRRRFEQFRIASGLISTNATEADRADYALVIGKFDAFFRVRLNVIFERARFNRRSQLRLPGETVEQYIMALYDLASNCAYYGAMESEMIRDRLVVGIRDSALSERLQLDADLTLDKAKKQIRQREAVQEQQLVLKGVGKPDTLEVVHFHTEHRNSVVPRTSPDAKEKRTEQAGTDRDRTLNSVAVVGKAHTHVTNALRRMLRATAASAKATMVPCAMPRLLLLSQQKVLATLTLHFLIQLHRTRRLHGSLMYRWVQRH